MAYNFSELKTAGGRIKEWFAGELATMRTSRATPALIENVQVDAYDTRSPLKAVATIGIEDARTMRVMPWDGSLLKHIEHALVASSLGGQVIVDKNTVRVVLPELTAERREMLVKLAGEKLEEARIRLRVERDETWKDIQLQERDGTLGEDDKFRSKDEMEKLIGALEKDFEAMAEKKRVEISS